MELDQLWQQSQQLFRTLQARICAALEELERAQGHDATFSHDPWQYAAGEGGGITRVLEDGAFLEKGGVNFSAVQGEFPEDFAATMPGSGRRFRATGISLVLHPRNPHVPTVHANFRFLMKGDGIRWTAWFGGGADLTPYYPRVEDARHFHRVWKQVCDRHPTVADYARFKRWCDEYFFVRHRGEPRGVGGIFFDYLQDRLPEVYAFVSDAGHAFLDAYLPIAERRRREPYGPRHRRWQLLRRGRYVEFNLVYDRGTLFGLRTGGRIESILMSLPPLVMWRYDFRPEPGSPEARALELLQPRDWLADEEEDDSNNDKPSSV